MLNDLLALRQPGSVLSAFGDDQLRRLADGAGSRRCAAGDVVARAGDAAEQVYIVATGRLVGSRIDKHGQEQVLAEMHAGEIADALELIVGGLRTVDLRAVADSSLIVLNRRTCLEVLEANPSVYREVTRRLQAQLRQQQLSVHLSRVFGPFDSSEISILDELTATAEFITLKSGEDLFRQDDPADAVYIVMSGLLRVATQTAEGAEHVINQVRSGESVGEMALLTNESRSATVYAVRDSVLASINRADFDRLIERYPKALKNLTRIIIERLKRRSTLTVRREYLHTSIGIIPTDPSVPLAGFTRELATHVGEHGSVILLTSDVVDRALGQPGVAQSAPDQPAYLRLAEWLHEQEETYRYLLYQADAQWTPWTERCARQADHIAIVGVSSGQPQVGETEARLAGFWRRGREPRRKLVLLHPPGISRPTNTQRWLAERAVDAVCHIRHERRSDYARLGRILSGRAIGVVLGGGGARGFAHLGALKALEALGVPVDLIAGSSIGSVMAVGIAQGHDADASIVYAKRYFSSLLDYTLPITSLLNGARITRNIEAFMGSWDIEDLWIPYFCVSTNLSTAKTMLHYRGSLARAVRASVSIPGVLPPVSEGDDLLVDGGVLNNLPVDLMREQNPTGLVIAIDVAPPEGPRAKGDFGLSVSGWRQLLATLNPWQQAAPIPGIASTILTSLVIGSAQVRRTALEEGNVDFYHNIRVSGVSMLQFERVEEVARIGYQESLEPFRAWIEAGGLTQT
ncbi:MAG: cyclic nucleotide-binding and patatin-like phospholipase domain-containing protein [Pseudomonadales bacterium]